MAAAGREPTTIDRYLNLDSAPVFSLSSPAYFAEAAWRAAALGFTDVVAADVLPALESRST